MSHRHEEGEFSFHAWHENDPVSFERHNDLDSKSVIEAAIFHRLLYAIVSWEDSERSCPKISW